MIVVFLIFLVLGCIFSTPFAFECNRYFTFVVTNASCLPFHPIIRVIFLIFSGAMDGSGFVLFVLLLVVCSLSACLSMICCIEICFHADESKRSRVLRRRAFRMLLSRISAISPGGEQQEIAGHKASRHDHRGKLLELFNGHPCIVMLPLR